MNYNDLANLYVVNEERTRQTGKTTALIEACKKIGGIFVAHSCEASRCLKQKYPEVTITAPRLIKLRGNNKPFIFDHFLLSLILSYKFKVIPICNQGTKYLKDQLELIKGELANRCIDKGELYIGVHEDEITNI